MSAVRTMHSWYSCTYSIKTRKYRVYRHTQSASDDATRDLVRTMPRLDYDSVDEAITELRRSHPEVPDLDQWREHWKSPHLWYTPTTP